MNKKIYSKKDIEILIKRKGLRNAFKEIYLQIRKNQNQISSRDVAYIYDSDYINLLDQHKIVKKVNGYSLNYFNIFVYEILKNKKAKILDVGCGPGNLCLALASKGCKTYGIDFNKIAIDTAKRRIGKMKNVFFSTNNFSSIKESFDYILFIDVVEHLSKKELVIFLKKAYSLLNKNGKVIIHTPNGLSDINVRRGITFLQYPLIIYDFFKHLFQPYTFLDVVGAYYTQTHINVMTPSELKKLLQQTKFRNIKIIFRDNKKGVIANLRKHLNISPDMGIIAEK